MTAPLSSKSTQPPPPPIRWKVIVLIPLSLYLCYLTALFFAQHRLIFPKEYAQGNPDAAPKFPGAEAVLLDTPSGEITTWFFPASEGTGTLALIAHGNAELAGDWFHAAATLADAGIGALVLEYPGYGNAPGSPSQSSIAPVLDAAFDFLSRRDPSKHTRIVGLGSSVGAATLCDLSRRRNLAALALISPFRSLKSMAWRHLAPPFLLRSPFDNAAALSAFDGRVLIIHGSRDEIIPHADGAFLASLDEDFALLSINSGHNDIHFHWKKKIEPAVLELFRSVDP